MTPTLPGRIQTRIFAVALFGGVWTLVISPVLPGGGALRDRYEATGAVLLMVGLLGVGWELVYHGLQQFRWEKDWPTMFSLLTGINEGILVWLLVRDGHAPGSPHVEATAFVVHFATTWLVIFLLVNGPMRVPFIRWRFRGGRLL